VAVVQTVVVGDIRDIRQNLDYEESEPEAPPDGIGKDAPAGLLQGTAPRYGRGASG